MGFVLTLIYVALTLLSPGIFPEAIYSLHISVILGAILILTLIPSIPGSKLGSSFEAYLAIGLLVATSISILMTGWMGGALQTFLDFSPILLTFFFVAISCRSLLRLKILTAVMVVVALFILSQGVIAFYSGNFASLYLEAEAVAGTVMYRFRGLGIISDPNDLAQLFVMLIPLLWLRWKKGHTASNIVFTLVPAAILILGIYCTHSRGGVIALMAVILFGLKDKLGLVKSSIFVGIALAGLLALNVAGGRGMNEDDGDRVGLWGEGLTAFKTHPFFGIGTGNFTDYSDSGLTAHNSYVLCLAEQGIVGYVFWMGMIVSGWSGLSLIVGSKAKGIAESESGAENSPDASRDKEAALVNPWLRGTATERTSVAVRPEIMSFSGSGAYAAKQLDVRPWSASLGMPEEDEATDQVSDEDRLVHAAKVIRIAMVGLLVTAFFLSRTYALTFYVLLGMALALKNISRETHPELTLSIRSLLQRTGLVIVGSIAFIYVFVRLFHRIG